MRFTRWHQHGGPPPGAPEHLQRLVAESVPRLALASPEGEHRQACDGIGHQRGVLWQRCATPLRACQQQAVLRVARRGAEQSQARGPRVVARVSARGPLLDALVDLREDLQFLGCWQHFLHAAKTRVVARFCWHDGGRRRGGGCR